LATIIRKRPYAKKIALTKISLPLVGRVREGGDPQEERMGIFHTNANCIVHYTNPPNSYKPET
jgi:hypothetical protein